MADKKSKLREFEEKFKKNEIEKADYVKKMHELHSELWSYLEFIQDKNINSINISGKEIFLEAKNGLKLIIDPEDERATPLEILNFGDYEAEEIKMMERFLKEDSIILDIGANIGWYSLNLAKKFPKCRIIAFEPIPKIFSYLNKNIELNNIKNIERYNFGFSDKEESIEFYYDPKLTGSTSLRNLNEESEKIKIRCNVKKIDDVIPELAEKIDFIKCDVEGAELFVMKGGIEVLKKEKPIIFLEMLRKWSAKFGYHPNEIIQLLGGIGYRCYYAEDGKLKEIDKITDETIATNFFFLPSNHIWKHINF